jgi:hypothetical protein
VVLKEGMEETTEGMKNLHREEEVNIAAAALTGLLIADHGIREICAQSWTVFKRGRL